MCSSDLCEKFEYKNIKIYSLTPAQANILKQTAISAGCDCATHREVITGKAELSDCMLGGSISQLKKIAEKLKFQPFGLKILGEKIFEFVVNTKNNRTKIAGILNITDNSFSDGGLYNSFVLLFLDRKSTRLNSSHMPKSRMPSSA